MSRTRTSERRIAPIRVLVLDVTGLLRDIIETTLSAQHDIEVLATEASVAPDVVVVALRDSEPPHTVEEVLGRYPLARVLGIARDGRRAFMHELRPHRLALGELSPEQLIEVVRRAGPSAGVNDRGSSWAWSYE